MRVPSNRMPRGSSRAPTRSSGATASMVLAIATFEKRRKKVPSWMRRLQPRKRLGIVFFFALLPWSFPVSRSKFLKLASSSTWYCVADEDAHMIPEWGRPIHLVVSRDRDLFMANCHCANDRQVVYQVVVRGDGQFVVQNAQALKVTIFQSLFPDLAYYPEA